MRTHPFARLTARDLTPLAGAALLIWTFVALAFLLSGCAESLKARASQARQSVRLALTSFDDTEHALCAPAATVPHDCTNPQAAAIGLTSALNQQIGAAMIKALEADKKVSAALIAWKAGDPPPTNLAELVADIQKAFDVAKTFAPAGSPLLVKAQAMLDEVSKLVVLIGGGS